MSHKSPIDDVRLYEWPGTPAFAELSSYPGSNRTMIFVAWHEGRPYSNGYIFDVVQMGDRVVVQSDSRLYEIPIKQRNSFRKKLLGLLIDLGVDRRLVGRTEARELVFSSAVDQVWSTVPLFIPDEIWDRRISDFNQYVSTDPVRSAARLHAFDQLKSLVDEPFLGHVVSLVVQDRGNQGIFARWGERRIGQTWGPSSHNTTSGDTVEEVMGKILDMEKLLPERDRPAWLEENATFGRFVVPTSDEVEIFRMMGERLPVLWPYDALCRWIESRKP